MTQTHHDTPGGILIPGLTAEQSENTILFLQQAANNYNTPYHILIMERHIRQRDAYLRHRDPETGKLVYDYDYNGEKICVGRAGIDWSKPAIYDLARGIDLYRDHRFPYPQKKMTAEGTKYIYKPRPSLLETVLNSSTSQSYLFYPVLVRKRRLMELAIAGNGDPYYKPRNYATGDVTAARCAWVDIDGHTMPLDEIKVINPIAISHLMEMLPDYCRETGVPMPAVVNSGRGIHLYWWFDQAALMRDTADLRRFQNLLNALGTWAERLIFRDAVCARAWQADSASSAIFHQMNLPGCVHPKTGATRYVVNKLGQDYFECDYCALCDALDVRDTLPVTCEPLSEEPEEIPDEEDEVMEDAAHDAAHSNPGRLNRLMDWAQGRGWDLYPGRENFLFVSGVLLHQNDPTLCSATPDHPLYAVNQQLTEPLPDEDVTNIIRELTAKAAQGTDAFSSGYIFSNAKIADFLGMTEEEQIRFCVTTPGMKRSRKADFMEKFYEFLNANPWDPNIEPYPAFKNRCYRRTCAWFSENRTPQAINAARSRRRAAQEGYTGKAGRPRRDKTADLNQCRLLRSQGLTQQQIAAAMGINQSTVSRLLTIMQ